MTGAIGLLSSFALLNLSLSKTFLFYRNLTLIAKTLQTLANFARYEGKENSMEFMNNFLDEESSNMAQFLATVSGAPPEDWLHGVGEGGERGELGRHLATLHTVLVDSVCKVEKKHQNFVKKMPVLISPFW